MIIILMGVCGSGKTTVGKVLAKKLHWSFADADEFHSEENKQKMSSGQPLTDQDRLPWLLNIHRYIESEMLTSRSAVVTCSALKKYYRQILLHGNTVLPNSGAGPQDICQTSYQVDGGSQRDGQSEEQIRNTEASVAKGVQLGKSCKESVINISSEDATIEQYSPTSQIDNAVFVYLSGTYTVLEKRLAIREGHFMPGSLLHSQLETLAPPDHDENSITVDTDKTVDAIVNEIIQKLGLTLVKST